jgi:tetratricopeptide (TPR) repeat protein
MRTKAFASLVGTVVFAMLCVLPACSHKSPGRAANLSGWQAFIKGDYCSAIRYYSESIRLDPNVAEVYCKRGSAYRFQGDDDKAIDDFSEAIRRNPKYASAYSYRGCIYGEKGNLDNALADFTDAIRYQIPGLVEGAYYDRGRVYEMKGDHDKAIADFNEAIRLDKRFAKPYF